MSDDIVPIYLTYAEAAKLVGLSRAQVANLVRARDFPKPVNVTPFAPRFDRAEVERWCEERKALRGTAEDERARAARRARSRAAIEARHR